MSSHHHQISLLQIRSTRLSGKIKIQSGYLEFAEPQIRPVGLKSFDSLVYYNTCLDPVSGYLYVWSTTKSGTSY